MHLRYRQTCRACGSSALTRVVDLGDQYIQGLFVKQGYPTPPLRRIPLQLVRCDPTQDQSACGLLQTSLSVPPAILYASYWYRSGTNRTMREHLESIADEAVALVGRERTMALDVGCNDGTLLSFYPDSVRKFGIDPSNAVETIPDGIEVVRDLFPSPELNARIGDRRFDIVTSIAMFYDLEDPVEFVRAVKAILAPDGIWIFEMSYMPAMLRTNSYDTVCHEHLEYYSLAVIESVLANAGMKVFRAAQNDINGGSIRCYATHRDNYKFKEYETSEDLADLRWREFELELDTDRPYRDFQMKAEEHRDHLTGLVKDLKRSGKRIHIYGASTKGNVILQFCGIDASLVDCAADRNPDKWGARTIGTDIPIVSEEESRRMRPDYYLVLPWHFRSEFVERERETLKAGTKLIFPLPEIEIVDEVRTARAT